MHEAALAKSVMDILTESLDGDEVSRGKRVRRITFALGRPRTVVPDSFSFYFEMQAKDTRYEGAELQFQESETRGFFIDSVDVED